MLERGQRANPFTWRTSPISPSSVSSRMRLQVASRQRLAPTARWMPAPRHASIIASHSASEIAMGFSAQIAFTPAARATWPTIAARGPAVVHTLTMSGCSRSSISR